MRAGAYGLTLLSDPLDVRVLLALADGPSSLIDLRRSVGSPPPTTLRKHLERMSELCLLIRRQSRHFPAPVSYELGRPGIDLLDVADALNGWLAVGPNGPIRLGDPDAKRVIKALVDGWKAKIVRALASRPLTLTQLDRLLPQINYPALDRRLSAMRLVGQLSPGGTGGGTRYQVTPWLSESIAPLLSAVAWERRNTFRECAPLSRVDAEAFFLLAAPLFELPSELEGCCRLRMIVSDLERDEAGVVVHFVHGRAVSSSSDRRADGATSWALGSAGAWLAGLRDLGSNECIEFGGTDDVAESLVAALPKLMRGTKDHDDDGGIFE